LNSGIASNIGPVAQPRIPEFQPWLYRWPRWIFLLECQRGQYFYSRSSPFRIHSLGLSLETPVVLLGINKIVLAWTKAWIISLLISSNTYPPTSLLCLSITLGMWPVHSSFCFFLGFYSLAMLSWCVDRYHYIWITWVPFNPTRVKLPCWEWHLALSEQSEWIRS